MTSHLSEGTRALNSVPIVLPELTTSPFPSHQELADLYDMIPMIVLVSAPPPLNLKPNPPERCLCAQAGHRFEGTPHMESEGTTEQGVCASAIFGAMNYKYTV